MAKTVTAEQTARSGFDFEDKVSAYFLTNLLADKPPLNIDIGSLQKIRYQSRSKGWLFDDILLTFNEDKSIHHVAVSSKSNRQIKGSGFPTDIKRDIWNQYLNIDQKVFNNDHD